MEYQDAKADLINFWGAIGTSWGVNKTMAQIYAVLLISDRSLSIEEIMSELNISRGNASMNVRSLISWGLIQKEVRPGERKEYFYGEKDVWQMSRKIAGERKKREIEPLLLKLKQVKDIDDSSPEAKEFKKVATELHDLITTFDLVLKKFINTDNKLAIKSLRTLLSIS
ncbi:transcriptional regulator [Fulvivirga sp. M361]|uniref:GbsR/MarR family transcriptional regulator n=1 Tax=Fulvivirga sp. M361 TaxID=2594266 RepID=UPI0011798D81|nr:MarR family transcriptional regulator [Fulvivirga sp. M361]TRX60200.1 transcriptional regulator [Fulvivirga sp. M361]